MTLKNRVLFAGLLISVPFGLTVSAIAEEEGVLGGEFSVNISMLTDYRFRGVSQNDESFALQGGLDWFHTSGFYLGTWASNISNFSGATMETNIYGGYSGEMNSLSFDVGGLLYHYPSGKNTDYFEAYGSVGMDLGFVAASIGANYAFSSDNLANNDNFYIFTNGDVTIPDTPVTLSLHFGYEDGALASDKWDWSAGLSVYFQGLDFGVSYVDTNLAGDNSDATVVFSVGASF